MKKHIGAIVLAAGGSTRFGSPKQLLTHDGLPLVRRAVIAAREAGADPVVVVVGAQADVVAEAIEEIDGVIAVTNPDWRTGLSSSLGAGLREMRDTSLEADGIMVVLADQPAVGAECLRALIAAFNSGHRIVAAKYSDTVGVPAVFGREHIDSLLALTGDRGAGKWLRERSDVTSIVLEEAGIDIDTPDDALLLEDL